MFVCGGVGDVKNTLKFKLNIILISVNLKSVTLQVRLLYHLLTRILDCIQ